MSQWTFTWVSRTRIVDCRTSQISLISGTFLSFLRFPAWKGVVFFQTLTWGTVTCCLKSLFCKFSMPEVPGRRARFANMANGVMCKSSCIKTVLNVFTMTWCWTDINESRNAFFVHWWFCPWKSVSTFANLFSEVSKGAPSKLNWEVGPRGILHDLGMNTVLETGLD